MPPSPGGSVQHGLSAAIAFLASACALWAADKRGLLGVAKPMNPAFLGDSYDLVKRFFVLELQSLGYTVAIDPMFTGDWMGREGDFHRLLALKSRRLPDGRTMKRCLFLDPDTGLNERGGKQHASFERVAREAQENELVFAFDQSFSRQASPNEVMKKKMSRLAEHGVRSIYYNSHARFLFASRSEELLLEMISHLVQVGMPRSRFVTSDA